MRRKIVAACALALCGCASPIKSGFVADQWTSNMEELGIYPVFPPREDFYVGDVYVTYDPTQAAAPAVGASPPTGAPKSKLPMLGVYFARLDVAQKLKAQYAARPEFGASGATASIFDAPPVQTRLKTVAFPYFFKATATGADIGAFVPVDGLPLKAGLSYDSIKSASVTVSAAESYALPWTDVASEVLDANGRLIVGNRVDAAQALDRARQLVNFHPDAGGAGFVDITVITEVFYARSFDVTFHLATSAAANLATSLPATPGAPAADAAPSTGAPATAATGNAAAAASPAASAASAPQASDVAAAIKAQADDAQARAAGMAPAAPGVSVGFVKSQGGDVGLRSTYAHPIAIGYRGVRYRMDLTKGTLVVIPPDHASPVRRAASGAILDVPAAEPQ
jgi:hypothetical protein